MQDPWCSDLAAAVGEERQFGRLPARYMMYIVAILTSLTSQTYLSLIIHKLHMFQPQNDDDPQYCGVGGGRVHQSTPRGRSAPSEQPT